MTAKKSRKLGRPLRPQNPAERTRIHPYLGPEIYRRFVQHCRGKGETESAVVEAAVRQYLDAVSDHTLVLRRLDRLGRADERTQRDLELLSWAFGLFMQFWFAHTPTIAADARSAARRNAASRYKQFVEHLATEFGRGRRFVDDLPKELLANDRELDAIAAEVDQAEAIVERQ